VQKNNIENTVAFIASLGAGPKSRRDVCHLPLQHTELVAQLRAAHLLVLLERRKVRRDPGQPRPLFCCTLFPRLDAVGMEASISSLSVRAHDAPPLPLSRARFCDARRALWRGLPRAPWATQSPDVLDELVLAVHGLADHVLELHERVVVAVHVVLRLVEPNEDVRATLLEGAHAGLQLGRGPAPGAARQRTRVCGHGGLPCRMRSFDYDLLSYGGGGGNPAIRKLHSANAFRDEPATVHIVASNFAELRANPGFEVCFCVTPRSEDWGETPMMISTLDC
jgi:hypothetical protein